MFLLLLSPWLHDLFQNNTYITTFVLLHGNWPFSVKLCVLGVPYVSSMDIISDSLVPFKNHFIVDMLPSFSREFHGSHVSFSFAPGC